MKRVVMTSLFVAFTWAPLAAAEPPPAPGEPRDFVLPASETIRLDNGLRVTFIDFGIVPKVTVYAVTGTGNIDDGFSTWLADVTVEMLKEGTLAHGAADLARVSAEMGGSLSVGTGAEQASVGISVLSEYAVRAAGLVADVLRNPRFPESELPRILANFERSVSVARSEPGTIADAALAALVYGDHPFGRMLPEPGQVAAYGIDDVRRFYADNFGAQRTHVYVAGRYDRPSLEHAIRTAFSGWTAGRPATIDPPRSQPGAEVQLIDRPGSLQSSVRIALPAPDPAHADYFRFTVMNTLLGGSFISRIVTNLREDKGYAYSPGSSIETHRRAALWMLDADVTTEATAAAITEVFGEIARLKSVPPPAAELKAVQNYRAGLFVVGNSSPGGVLGQLAFADLHGLPPEFLTHWVASLHAVTPDEVSAAAADWLNLSNMKVVVVGDLGKIESSIRSLPRIEGAVFR